MSLGEQWQAYGRRPPMGRWVSRVAFVVGVLIGAGLIIGAVVMAAKLVVWLIRS